MFAYLDPPSKKEWLGLGLIAVPKNTARRMVKIIKESSYNPYVRKWAEKIVEGVKDRDEQGEIRALFRFMQKNTRFARDPRGMEYIQTPPYVLKHIEMGDKPSLDCDDYTVTGMSLARALGYRTAIRVVGYKKGAFSHVYGMVRIKGDGWVMFDAVRKDIPLGWESKWVEAMDLEVK